MKGKLAFAVCRITSSFYLSIIFGWALTAWNTSHMGDPVVTKLLFFSKSFVSNIKSVEMYHLNVFFWGGEGNIIRRRAT